jgi:hypothetical protein
MAVYKPARKLTGTRTNSASKQAGGIGDRSEAFGASGTQDRKPKSLKQIQVAEKMVPRFLGQYNNRLSGTPSIGVEFAPRSGISKLHDNRRVRLEALVKWRSITNDYSITIFIFRSNAFAYFSIVESRISSA